MQNLNFVQCPSCSCRVHDRAPACPQCGTLIYVEHPGDIKGVKHKPLDLKPVAKRVYRPTA